MTTANATPNNSEGDPVLLQQNTRLDRAMEWIGERFNPILIKEARQSLKSRQFILTFGLVLAAGWLWSIAGVAFLSPEIHYSARGNELLVGYYWILSFPLIVIVPFGAFRSLAVEIEDGTFELISVSTLTPHQIVAGKLASTVLQGLIYFCALSPCILFTYLLRGIDMTTIAALLFYASFTSVVFAVTGLFLATVSQTKVMQMLVNVGIVIALFVVFIYTGRQVGEFLSLEATLPLNDPFFWEIQIAVTSVGTSFGLLFYMAAAARITFPSENRSTRLRAVMILQHFVLICWMVYAIIRADTLQAGYIYCFIGVVYWYLMGSLMLGESDQLSQRVKRTLPQSSLGKTLFSWLMPGQFSGFQFAVMNALSLPIILYFIERTQQLSVGFGPPFSNQLALVIALLFVCYLSFYLSISRIVIQLLSKVTYPTPILGLLMGILVFLFGSVTPYLIRVSLDNQPTGRYYYWELTNPVVTISHVFRNFNPDYTANDQLLRILICVIGGGVMGYIVSTIIGIGQVRIAHEQAPERVRVEESRLQVTKSQTEASSEGDVHPLD